MHELIPNNSGAVRLCGVQTPRKAVPGLSINTTVGHFDIDSGGSIGDSGRRAACSQVEA